MQVTKEIPQRNFFPARYFLYATHKHRFYVSQRSAWASHGSYNNLTTYSPHYRTFQSTYPPNTGPTTQPLCIPTRPLYLYLYCCWLLEFLSWSVCVCVKLDTGGGRFSSFSSSFFFYHCHPKHKILLLVSPSLDIEKLDIVVHQWCVGRVERKTTRVKQNTRWSEWDEWDAVECVRAGVGKASMKSHK